MISLDFLDGSLVLHGQEGDLACLGRLVVQDERIGAHRALACHYAEIRRVLHPHGKVEDRARAYADLSLVERNPRQMRDYQRTALEAWLAARRRGVVVLPTGAGKTYVAIRAILACQRSTLVVVPTIDLVQQWACELAERFGVTVGRYGGGEKDLRDLTVATYDSGVLIAPWHGNRFGLLICDECHHLPAEVTSRVAEACIAPFRLGLSATPERGDGRHDRLDELLGPVVHRSRIDELEGRWLADYQAEVIEVAMDADEFAAYQHHRQIYLGFIRGRGFDFSRPDGWQEFLRAAARDPTGRQALKSWREQKRLSRASRAKLRAVWQLLCDHPGDRCLIFTDDNETAYRIGRDLFLPVLTHQTRPTERQATLDAFRCGDYRVLVTSRVLNEGVDVPEASVGIVVSGSGSVREHVQRLGRILRPGPDKVATLYEILSADTAEANTSERRRQHAAFGEGDPAGPDLFDQVPSC